MLVNKCTFSSRFSKGVFSFLSEPSVISVLFSTAAKGSKPACCPLWRDSVVLEGGESVFPFACDFGLG